MTRHEDPNYAISKVMAEYAEKKTAFQQYAITHKGVVYTENYRDELRRPIVVISEKELKTIKSKIEELNELAQQLHNLSPKKFYLDSKYLQHEPKIVRDVANCHIYVRKSVSSSQITTTAITDRLRRLQKRFYKLHKELQTEEHGKALHDQMNRFEAEPEDKKWRLRVNGTTDVQCSVAPIPEPGVALRDAQYLVRVTAMGLFIVVDGKNEAPKITQPETGVNETLSAYDLVKPVKCLAYPTGHIYDIDELNKAEIEVKDLRAKVRSKKQLGYQQIRRANAKNNQ
ncbi:hypothetical protein [Thaumasiovibrio sp. DFM-14]|uniref:hypothetical protein n=1 Tax=Thaumasiovibrio sp. DFM-14 TaxID=3384792 RepID=UPI00399FD569